MVLIQLDKPEDLRADDLGSWVCKSKRLNICEVEDGHVTEVFSGPSIKRENTLSCYTILQACHFKGFQAIAEIYGKLLFV